MPPEEPEAHCYDCPNRFGDCAEYTALSPTWLKMGLGNYDRGHCHWGASTISELKPIDILDIVECPKCEISLVVHSYTNTHLNFSCPECDFVSKFYPRFVKEGV